MAATVSTTPIVIDPRFNGPDGSANGGWSAGLLASRFHPAPGEAVEVTLRLPPPLDRELEVRAEGGSGMRMYDGEALVAEARRTSLDLQAPAMVAPDVAREASERFPFRGQHPFPRCFCCGTGRTDGLGIHCGSVAPVTAGDAAPADAANRFADVWTPAPEFATDAGRVTEPAVWSALDCPSAAPWANPDAGSPMVLGRFTVRLDAPVIAGEEHVLVAWPVREDGRKHWSGSALASADGRVLGVACALWIELRDAPTS